MIDQGGETEGGAAPPEAPTRILRFQVDIHDHRARIDTFLSHRLRNYTTWRLRRWAECGGVTVDHQPAGPDTRVFAGQSVMVRLLEPPDKIIPAEPRAVDPLHVDPWLAVLNKPPGVVVHPTGPVDSGTLCHHLQAWLDERAVATGLIRPGIVHRLDRETSGALAVAFEAEAHRELADDFESSRVSKAYLALVQGLVATDRLEIRTPIGRSRSGSRVLMSCRGDAVDRKPAVTNVRVLYRFTASQLTLVRCLPRTGRNHQIRVHLASVGHPLVCDPYYGAKGTLRTEQSAADERGRFSSLGRHALHAERLAFAHPIGGGWLDVTAPIAADFAATLREIHASEIYPNR